MTRASCCIALITLALGSGTLVSGCGLTPEQKSAVLQFSRASNDVAEVGREEFINSRNDVIEMNRLRVALGEPTEDVGNLDGSFTTEVIVPRLDALAALGEYSQLLETLVTTDYKGDLEKASDEFVSSLRAVKGVALSDDQAGALGNAVMFIGWFFLEWKRKSAVKEVVDLAHPHMMKLTELLEEDFSPDTQLWKDGYRLATQDLRGHIASLDSPTGLPSQKLLAEARLLADENWKRFDQQVSKRMLTGAAKLREALENLQNVLTSSSIGTDDIKALEEYARELKTIYDLWRG